MSFLNKPVKTLEANVTSVLGTEFLPWYNPLNFPSTGSPAPSAKAYRWKIEMSVASQNQSSYLTRNPGLYNGYDVTIGQWIANATTGQAWQIISIESKSANSVVATVQDIYRYNTFRDTSQVGNGGLSLGVYVIFNLSGDGIPQIDPVPPSGISSNFTQNLISRFTYNNLQYDYALYQADNTFAINDVIAVDNETHRYVLADEFYKIVIGRVTSVSDAIPGWFTINPINKIVDFLDSLPGDVGDQIYSSTDVPGELSLDSAGSPIYIKLRNQTVSKVSGTSTGPTTSGSIISLNSVNITVGGTGSAEDLVSAINSATEDTGVNAELSLSPSSAQTISSNISTIYGEPALFAASNPVSASINGVLVTFSSRSSVPGYEDYSLPTQMAKDINNANIPNISAEVINSGTGLKIINDSGGIITISNVNSDTNGVPFAGPNSGSGISLSTSASTQNIVKFTAIDARAINFLDVQGSVTLDFGLVSVENGTKAAGLYIQGGVRQAGAMVVTDLAFRDSLTPLIGDQAYVIDSNDGNNNYVNQWSNWLWDGSDWVLIARQSSASVDSKTLSYTLTNNSPLEFNIGTLTTGRRIASVAVNVSVPFNGLATLALGYLINNSETPVTSINGLMAINLNNLNAVGIYTADTGLKFGVGGTPGVNVDGDVTVTGTFNDGGSTQGAATIIITYV
jgi:hypothetical protein